MNNHIAYTSEYLSQIYSPKLVIDVGVGNGTPALYEAYPKAKFLLIEPLKEFSKAIKEVEKKYDCDVIYKGLGSEETSKRIRYPGNDLQKASFSIRSTLTRSIEKENEKQVEITTLNNIFKAQKDLQFPILLKIDTEGYELEVLKGASNCLEFINMVIAEVSISKRFEDGYSFEEMIHFMSAKGFKVFSFLTMKYKKEDLQPKFSDVVFKRMD